MNPPRRPMYAFGPFRLDVDGQRLWRGEDVVPLQAKAFELRTYLVERPDALAAREVLQDALWPDVVVTDQSLRQAVRRVRDAPGRRRRRAHRCRDRSPPRLPLPRAGAHRE